jgi:hypothetical protein
VVSGPCSWAIFLLEYSPSPEMFQDDAGADKIKQMEIVVFYMSNELSKGKKRRRKGKQHRTVKRETYNSV